MSAVHAAVKADMRRWNVGLTPSNLCLQPRNLHLQHCCAASQQSRACESMAACQCAATTALWLALVVPSLQEESMLACAVLTCSARLAERRLTNLLAWRVQVAVLLARR